MTLLDGESPQGIDYTQEEDPYKARYGESWEIEIGILKCPKSQCCVTDLIELMMTEGEKFFKGTKREKRWYLYHNILSLMTEKGCIA